MKKLTLVGVSLLASATCSAQEANQTKIVNSSNVKPGQEIAFITQNNEKILFTYEDLLNQLRGSNAAKIKNIQIENTPVQLNFLDDLSIDVSLKGQTDAPANVRGGGAGE